MAPGQRIKIAVLVVVVIAVPLFNVAVVAGAIAWSGPLPNLNALAAALQLVCAGFAGVAAARRGDED